MATPSTRTTSESVNEMPALAHKLHEQLVAAVERGHRLSLNAAQAWVKAVSVVPVMDLPAMPLVARLPAMPSMESATTYAFDVAADLLSAQRDYAVQMAGAFATAKATGFRSTVST